jgi:predicted dehydrogenase/threonine dehydrogenase-like Zn-dependent dehydrogenase
MKQVVQNYSTGELKVEDVPVPICDSGSVVVQAAYSLVSAGTERMKVDQARMNLLQMAKARPDKVEQVIQSVKQVGLKETVQKVRERLDSLTPLGYSLAGVVEEVGGGIDEFAIGDRVACAGEKIACHAEFVCVPRNLCTKVPDGVDLKDAAFSTVGAIAMNGVRQAQVSIGDTVLVIGLGLVGLLAVQILKAAGCRIVGVDLDRGKVDLARACGADLALARSDAGLEDAIRGMTRGIGMDVAYLAASTKSSDPLQLAGEVLRDRGKAVIVGMIPIEADWQTFYRKEISVLMSRSYGPGRYDQTYELKGIDYPVGYVRWTERRNLESFLDLIAAGKVQPSLLKPEVFKIEDAPTAYRQLHDQPGKHAVGMLFEYPQEAPIHRKVESRKAPAAPGSKTGTVGLGVIGAGNFATATLIPAMKKCEGVALRGICSASGLSAASAARRHGFAYSASGIDELLADESIDGIVIATRHDTHARFAAQALRARKHVYVEKPLALTREQLDEVIAAKMESDRFLVVGYNRRFSPLSVAVRDFFTQRSSPIEVVCRVNAGALKEDSWYQDAEEGGWRIISEGCHFVDLIQFICGCPVKEVFADMIAGAIPGGQNDNCMVTLKMEDGSLGSVVYVANGDSRFEKERLEVFGQGRAAVIENWHVARLSAKGKVRKVRPAGAGKGHMGEMAVFVEAIRSGKEPPLTFDQCVSCTLATFAAAKSLATRQVEPCA